MPGPTPRSSSTMPGASPMPCPGYPPPRTRASPRGPPASHDLDGATEVARAVLSSNDRPTAVFCLNDALAYGVYAAARELGLTIPDDVSVLGFDDHPVSRLATPPPPR